MQVEHVRSTPRFVKSALAFSNSLKVKCFQILRCQIDSQPAVTPIRQGRRWVDHHSGARRCDEVAGAEAHAAGARARFLAPQVCLFRMHTLHLRCVGTSSVSARCRWFQHMRHTRPCINLVGKKKTHRIERAFTNSNSYDSYTHGTSHTRAAPSGARGDGARD